MPRPLARTEGLVSETVDDGLVIYDRETDIAHALSGAVARVFERCDGTADAAQIAAATGLAPALVEQAIAELADCGLLEQGPPPMERITRRQMIGAAALAAPLIYSVVVPPAYATASNPYCASNCADYTPIAPADCSAAGSPGSSALATPGVCQSGTCYETLDGTYQCAPANCVPYGNLGCTPYTGYGATPCCSTPSACGYVAAEMAYGCYS